MRNTIVKLNLTSPIEIITFPTLQLSVEKKILGSFSLAGEFGYQLYHVTNPTFSQDIDDTSFTKTRGMKSNIELRFYLQKNKRLNLTGLYTGVRVFYWQNKYNENLAYYPIADTTRYRDFFGVKKKNWGINGLVGYQKNVGKHFLFDFSAAVGRMHRKSTNNHREYNGVDFEPDAPVDVNVWAIKRNSSLAENNGWTASVNFTVRFGYRF